MKLTALRRSSASLAKSFVWSSFVLTGLFAPAAEPAGSAGTVFAPDNRQTSFDRVVSIGFDDFRKSDFSLVAPLFERYGARTTFNRIAWNADMTTNDIAELRRLEDAGHEIGDHTWWHWNGIVDDPLMNGQDPAHPDGVQVPFPSNPQMREDRGDGRNAFGFPLEDPVEKRLSDYDDYAHGRWSAFDGNVTWGRLTDAQCQKIRDYFALFGNPGGKLDVLDGLSNRYLGTKGHSRGSWDEAKGCYTGGLFTGCRSSANHAVWWRILKLTQAVYRAQYRKDFRFDTWSWPGCQRCPFEFRFDHRSYYDPAGMLPVNALSRFGVTDGNGVVRQWSWTETLRAAGYKTTHDMTYPGRRDCWKMTMMRRELFFNASFSRRDALAYSTGCTIDYDAITREYPESFFTNGLARAAADMYDDGRSFHLFVEAVRHDTASGLVHGEVIDSVDNFSERMFLEESLKFCKRAGVRVIPRREAFEACFGRTRTDGNLIRNVDFRNMVEDCLPGVRRMPTNPDGYRGACRVETPDGVRTLVTQGATTNIVYGVPPGTLSFAVRAKGRGRIRIFAVRNKSPITLAGLEELAALDVDATAFVPVERRFDVPDAPETAYEPRWEGLGDKVMALLIVYDAGLGVRKPDLRCRRLGRFVLDANLPAGCLKAAVADGDRIHLTHDFRDTEGPWFY